MKITKEAFPDYLSAYEEDELFYYKLYRHQQEDSPEDFQAYLRSLDMEYIHQRLLYVPQLIDDKNYRYMTESNLFSNMPGNILLAKHFRYTPEFQHEHEFFEVLYAYKGKIPTTIQGIHHFLNPGDVCIIPPNTKHSIGIFDDSLLINLMIRTSTFQSTFFDLLTENNPLSQFFSHVLYRKTEGNYLLFQTGEDEPVRSLIEDLYIEYRGHEKYSNAFLNTVLMLFWATLLRRHEHHILSFVTKEHGSAPITDMLDYIALHYREISLTEAAGRFGFSAPHFSSLIKESTGRTFGQIVKDIKMGQACRALTETSLNLHAICQVIGYEHPEHFMRTFKKYYGMTPSEYRKAHQERAANPQNPLPFLQ